MASTKSPWESRVGMLLDPAHHPEFLYSFKPVDSAMYGGQPRIDRLAADRGGFLWMVEVKYLAPGRKTLNLERDISAGQVAALTAVSKSEGGVPLLMVGQREFLHVFDWRKITWLLGSNPIPLLSMSDALFSLVWTGPKAWNLINLYGIIHARLPLPRVVLPAAGVSSPPPPPPGLATPLTTSGPPWLPIPPAPSPPISKRPRSTRTKRREILSAL